MYEFSPAVEVVQKSLDAFNARNAEAFADCLADDAYIGDEPYRTVGKAACFERYKGLFERCPNIHVTLLARMVLGQYVLDKEYVTSAGDEPFVSVSINRVKDGKIVSMTFLEGEDLPEETSS